MADSPPAYALQVCYVCANQKRHSLKNWDFKETALRIYPCAKSHLKSQHDARGSREAKGEQVRPHNCMGPDITTGPWVVELLVFKANTLFILR